MQLNALQINFASLVAPKAANGTSPGLDAEATGTPNADSFSRLLQSRQQGAALQAAAEERRAAQASIHAPIKAPPAPTPTPQTQKTANIEKPAQAQAEKAPERDDGAKSPTRSDGPRRPDRLTRSKDGAPPADGVATEDPSVKADPKDGPVTGMSEWWVPMPTTTKTSTTPTDTPVPTTDDETGADAALSDMLSRLPTRAGAKPAAGGDIRGNTDLPLPAGPASAELNPDDSPICLAPDAGDASVASATEAAAAAPSAELAAGMAAALTGAPSTAAGRTPAAALRADREDALARIESSRGDSARGELTRVTAQPLTAASIESRAAGSEAARVAPAAAAAAEGRSFAETLAAVTPAGMPTARSEAATAPVSVAIATPATAPEFREALGVQVSLLVKDGVQSAELHLNPTDMGPISVQITTDGVQAQIDFGADSATTRQIIEQGLPELASALRDAGITLTGGGVSQHARGQNDEGRRGGADDGRRSSRRVTVDGIDGNAAAPAARSVQMSRGQVDLYA